MKFYSSYGCDQDVATINGFRPCSSPELSHKYIQSVSPLLLLRLLSLSFNFIALLFRKIGTSEHRIFPLEFQGDFKFRTSVK